MSKVLAEHQIYALEVMEANPSLGIFYAAGCGKTIIAITWIRNAIQMGAIESALIVCPASLVGNWERSIDDASSFDHISEQDVEMLKSRVSIRSFQKVYKTVKTPVKHRDGVTTYKRKISLREDVDRTWGAVFVDESHCIGAHDSIQTKACIVLSKLARYRYIMTGTPVSGGKGQEDYQKLYGQMRFLDPNRWPTWKSFCEQCVRGYDRWGKPVTYNKAVCEGIMRDNAIVARLEDCYDMPERTESFIPCELAERRAYKDILAGNLEPYGLDIEAAGAQYIKLLQICSGSLKRDDGTVMKMKCSKDDVFAEFIDGTDDKVVVFCQYTASIDRCTGIGRKHGRKVVVYDGRSKGDTWEDFQFGDADMIVAQYAKGGPGLDLFASHTMIMFEPCLSALLLEQSMARIFRKGQIKHCVYLMLYTPKTFEKKAWDTVRSGKDVTADMMMRWAHGEDIPDFKLGSY